MPDQLSLSSYNLHKQDWDDYDALHEAFEWVIPQQFNMADYACDRWADGSGRRAIIAEEATGRDETFTFDDLERITDALAAHLAEQGVERGDRIGVNVPQRPEVAMAHLAAWKLGAVSVPLSTLFGPDGLRFRLTDADATACIVDETNLEAFRAVRGDLDLASVLTVGEHERTDGETAFWDAVSAPPDTFDNANTAPEDDAVIIYTSGTTGDPKGALHSHSLLLGTLASFTLRGLNLTDDPDEVLWSPVEWSWIGTLFGMLFPALCLGKTMVAHHAPRFDPETALDLIGRHEVTGTMFPPTAVRKMMQATDPAAHTFEHTRVVAMGGEPVDETLVDWVAEMFDGAVVHEAYGQTEVNGPIGDCTKLYPSRPGVTGKPTPGHEIAIVDPETAEATVETGEIGEIAVRYEGNPACFKGYWNAPDRTDEKIRNGWLLTEDLGRFDEDGYIHFEGRKDSVIISSGYRIGPEEIAEVLATHEAVANAAVIGIPDEELGEVPKAFITLVNGAEMEGLDAELQQHAKERLAKHEYPHEIEVLEALPKTSTGKIDRASLETK